ncbi:type III secretion system chaperone [Roseiconus lacunae]|uniref:type III secretion system chaperone n=1 Tax=Roseiconus lacunae TaxID=2605694 RepID=UPI001E579BF0|nr:type III secretion system chaperone [Roseiconus lacunae]MCD0457860.1 type III secretion system chaperone [Roseiconus lacunae]
MSRINHVANVFADLGREMNMGPLKLDDTDRLSLLFDGVLVTFSYSTEPMELIWIYVDLGEIPSGGVLAMQRLLACAFESWMTSIMTIGMDDDGRNAVGFTSIPVSTLSVQAVRETVGAMLRAAAKTSDAIAAAAFEQVQGDATNSASCSSSPSPSASEVCSAWARA